MAHRLSSVLHFPLITADNRRRPLRKFLFDDRSWLVRYAVVDAGNWLIPRMVAVPTSALDTPDWTRKTVSAALPFDQLIRQPRAESIRTVARQRQIAWNRHFGWQGDPPNSVHPPAVPRREYRLSGAGDDPHLRSTENLFSYQVWRRHHCIGRLEGYFLDDRSWHIAWLLVRTGDWAWHEMFVPTADVTAISWGEGRIDLRTAAIIA